MKHKLNPTFSEFLYALIRLRINKNIIFGLILGLPFPILLMWQDFYSSGWAFSLENLGLKLSEHSYHYIFIFLPILTGLVAGVFGSVRRDSARRIKALIEELEKLSNVDSLTTLYTRRYFDCEIAKEFQRASRNNTTFAVVAIDLDNLKALNDNDGHPVGDAVLESIGRIIHENSRIYDVPARLGGDEFTI
ncbi:MAG: diguanylate cyclase, partial [candidate division Zixibacteria bacterium]|nr:diguanylate cyclase [candidate division Zixibacteria bacterium]